MNIKLHEKIDFMDIDVEGLDCQVLVSNNWDSFRPKLVKVEVDNSIGEDFESEVYKFMKFHKYKLLAKMVQTSSGSGNLIFSK